MKGFTQNIEDEESPSSSYSPFGIKATFHHGAILPHRSEVNEVIEGHTQAYELSFNKSTSGKRKWQQLYSYPKGGVSLLAIDLGNEKELGMGFGLFPFIELPLNQGKIHWRFKVGYGLSYIQKPFNRETNNKNVAIGSYVNAIIYANVLADIKLTEAFNASLGTSLIHFSNGSFERPNLGINILSLNTGLTYSFGEKRPRVSTKFEERPHKWTKKMIIGVGLKEIPPVDGKKYVVSTYSFNFIKTRAEKSSFGFGADLFYNTSLTDLIARDSTSTSNGLNNFRLGLIGMYSFDFGKFSVFVGVGGYMVSTYKGNGLIYNRLGTRFKVNDKLFLRLAMKTHIVVADFVEFGVGYNFN